MISLQPTINRYWIYGQYYAPKISGISYTLMAITYYHDDDNDDDDDDDYYYYYFYYYYYDDDDDYYFYYYYYYSFIGVSTRLTYMVLTAHLSKILFTTNS